MHIFIVVALAVFTLNTCTVQRASIEDGYKIQAEEDYGNLYNIQEDTDGETNLPSESL
jgi:hypothetical protein